MRFSIVTPSYNQAHFIRDTIDSVISQEYRDFEYIVVDGMSQDGTKQVLEDYAHKITKTIIEEDSGQADAINKGFRAATGDIYAYLNSDDYYFEDTLARVYDVFSQNPDVDVIYGDCVFTDENGQFLRYFSEISDFNEDRLRNFSDILMQPATFWRKSAYDKYGPFDKELHYGFDWAFWCELAKNGCRFRRIAGVLAANRVYPQTKTISGSADRLKELKQINNRYKTRRLAHAYYRYCLGDIVEKGNAAPIDYIRIPFLILLSYGNILHHFKNYSSKIICGFLPKSNIVLKKADIRMPRLEYRSIRISLKAPKDVDQVVTVTRSGREVGRYEFSQGCVDIEMELDSGREVDIGLLFDKEYKIYRSSMVSFFQIYKPRYVAAEIISVLMS